MDTSFDFRVNTEVHHYIYDSETKKIHMRSAKISKVYDTYVVLVYWDFKTKAWHTMTIRKAHILSGRIISRKGKFYLWSISMNDDAVKRQFWDYFWEKATTYQEKYIQNIQILADFGNNVYQPEINVPIEWQFSLFNPKQSNISDYAKAREKNLPFNEEDDNKPSQNF